MMLMNSKSRQYLIQEQVQGAKIIKQSNIETLSMGYIICSPGGKAGEVGKVELIQPHETDLISAYTLCAEFFNFDILYLEAGSGADTPVSPNIIQAARQSSDKLIIIVGGGIRNGKTAKIAVDAGADWIVTGNFSEEFEDNNVLQTKLKSLIQTMKSS